MNAPTLHLRPVPDEPRPSDLPPPCYAVMLRDNGHWSPAAKIMSTHASEDEAEAEAEHRRELQPHLTFGVFALRSEARPKPKTVETVRVQS